MPMTPTGTDESRASGNEPRGAKHAVPITPSATRGDARAATGHGGKPRRPRRLGSVLILGALAWLGCGSSSAGGPDAGASGGSKATGGASASTGGQAGGTGGKGSAGTGGAASSTGGTSAVPGAGPFPSTSTFYQDISQAPVDSESSTIMAALDKSGWALGIDVSFTILTADPSLARTSFQNGGDDPDCDTSPVPLPSGGNIESSTDYTCQDGGDCHLLVYQGQRLYEGYQADFPQGKKGSIGCLVVWDLTRDYWQPKAPPGFSRGDHCNGADAADLPMAPLILTKNDITSGELKHALRFTIPNGKIRASVYVHPATHIGGPSGP